MLDTDISSYVIRRRPPAIAERFERYAEQLCVSVMTAAELRLLPMLSTHLSFPEIARELFLSRNTVKSQAISIYRKLGVSSRTQALEKAAELGLLSELSPLATPGSHFAFCSSLPCRNTVPMVYIWAWQPPPLQPAR